MLRLVIPISLPCWGVIGFQLFFCRKQKQEEKASSKMMMSWLKKGQKRSADDKTDEDASPSKQAKKNEDAEEAE